MYGSVLDHHINEGVMGVPSPNRRPSTNIEHAMQAIEKWTSDNPRSTFLTGERDSFFWCEIRGDVGAYAESTSLTRAICMAMVRAQIKERAK